MASVTGNPRHASVSEALEAEVQRLDGHDGESEVVIDLSGVDRISSGEINQLIRTYGIVRRSGSTLVIENAHEQLIHIFTLTRLDRLIKIRESAGD
jgi:anti-anti-sigma factor